MPDFQVNRLEGFTDLFISLFSRSRNVLLPFSLWPRSRHAIVGPTEAGPPPRHVVPSLPWPQFLTALSECDKNDGSQSELPI